MEGRGTVILQTTNQTSLAHTATFEPHGGQRDTNPCGPAITPMAPTANPSMSIPTPRKKDKEKKEDQ